MKNKHKDLIKKIKSQKGTTIVELVVSFTLICLFLLAAGQVLTSFLNVYTKINSYINQQQIASILLERTSGIISKCSRAYEAVDDEYAIVISDDGHEIVVLSADGVRTTIKTDDENHLRIIYSAVIDTASGTVIGDETQTGYGNGFYMGNIITDLSFEKVGEGLIKITVILNNTKTNSEFSSVKIVYSGVTIE